MSRSKTGVVRRRRHKRILKQTKGYYLTRSKLIRKAKEAYIRAGEHAFAGRKLRKRDMKKLWIMRLSAALRENGTNYSTFVRDLNKSKINLDRKVLADLAVNQPETFKKVLDKVVTK